MTEISAIERAERILELIDRQDEIPSQIEETFALLRHHCVRLIAELNEPDPETPFLRMLEPKMTPPCTVIDLDSRKREPIPFPHLIVGGGDDPASMAQGGDPLHPYYTGGATGSSEGFT